MGTAILPNCSPTLNPCQPSITASSYKPPPSPLPAYLATAPRSSQILSRESSRSPSPPLGTLFVPGTAREGFPGASLPAAQRTSDVQLSPATPTSTKPPTRSPTSSRSRRKHSALAHSPREPRSQRMQSRSKCCSTFPLHSSCTQRPCSQSSHLDNGKMACSCCPLSSPWCVCSPPPSYSSMICWCCPSTFPTGCICSQQFYPIRIFSSTEPQLGDVTQHLECTCQPISTQNRLPMINHLKNSRPASPNIVTNPSEHIPEIHSENRQNSCIEDLAKNKISLRDSRKHLDHPITKGLENANVPCTHFGETCFMNALPCSSMKHSQYLHTQADDETNRVRVMSAFPTRGRNVIQNRDLINSNLTHSSEDLCSGLNKSANHFSTNPMENHEANTDQYKKVLSNHSTDSFGRAKRLKQRKVNGSQSSGLPVTSSTTNVKHNSNPVEKNKNKLPQSICEIVNSSTTSSGNTHSLASYFANLMANTDTEGNTTEKITCPVHHGNAALHVQQRTSVPLQCQVNRLEACAKCPCPLHSPDSMFRELICPMHPGRGVVPEFKALTLHLECTCPKHDCPVHATQWARLTMETPVLPHQEISRDICRSLYPQTESQGVKERSSRATADAASSQQRANADCLQNDTYSGSAPECDTEARDGLRAGVGVGPGERLRHEIGARIKAGVGTGTGVGTCNGVGTGIRSGATSGAEMGAGVGTETGIGVGVGHGAGTGLQFEPGIGAEKEAGERTGARRELSTLQDFPTRSHTPIPLPQSALDHSALQCPVHNLLAQLLPLCTCHSASKELRPVAAPSPNPALPNRYDLQDCMCPQPLGSRSGDTSSLSSNQCQSPRERLPTHHSDDKTAAELDVPCLGKNVRNSTPIVKACDSHEEIHASTRTKPVFKLRGGRFYSDTDRYRKNGVQDTYDEITSGA